MARPERPLFLVATVIIPVESEEAGMNYELTEIPANVPIAVEIVEKLDLQSDADWDQICVNMFNDLMRTTRRQGFPELKNDPTDGTDDPPR